MDFPKTPRGLGIRGSMAGTLRKEFSSPSWMEYIVTAAFNDRISNDRSRRSFSVPTSAALSNESTLVKRGSACRSKARRPRPSPRPCRRCGKPLFATSTGFSSSARRTQISSTWSISRRPCDDGVSEAVVGPAAADRMTVERPVRPIVRSRICARVHARVLFGTCLTGVGGSGWRASRGRGIHGVRPGWCGLRPPSGLAGRGGSNETGKGRQDTRAARARFGKRRRSNAWFLQHENTWRYPISDEPLKYNGPPELEVAVLS